MVKIPYADAMLVKLPGGVEPAVVASASDNMPDAYRAVGPQLVSEPDAEILVVGGGAAAPSAFMLPVLPRQSARLALSISTATRLA